MSIGVFSSGRDWLRLDKDFDDVKFAQERNDSLERKFELPSGVFSPGRDCLARAKFFFAKKKKTLSRFYSYAPPLFNLSQFSIFTTQFSR